MAGLHKTLAPRSLFGRALLILLAPIVVLQLVVAGLFVNRHYAGVTQQMSGAVALELIYAVETVERAPDAAEAQRLLAQLARPLGLRLTLEAGVAVRPGLSARLFDVSGEALAETLREVVNRPMHVDMVSAPRDARVRIATDKGALRAEIPRKRAIASNPHILLVWMTATAALLTIVAVLFLRNQVRPIRQLALAAEAFGRGRAAPFRPAGAEEVRRAGAAFLDMRRRIERSIEQRSNMLYGVSHDLRTPLTRMKLALAMCDETDPEIAELRRDVREMERMLDEFLDFARGGQGEAPASVDPRALLEAAVADLRRGGAEVALEMDGEAGEIVLRGGAVRRALANLLENAARHGRHVLASLRVARGYVEFAVEDDGPGIPESDRERAFRPFTRLDPARNQDKGGGVGLGLAIAIDIAHAHGGTLTLEDGARLGGLRAVLRLPR